MKRNLKSVLLVAASSLLLMGCCGTRHATQQWEYKVAVTPIGSPGTLPTTPAQREKLLNELAQDGWVLVTTEGDSLYVKRPKR